MSRKYLSQSMLCGVDEQASLQSLLRWRSYSLAKLRLRGSSTIKFQS
jgi:hypothetical protein